MHCRILFLFIILFGCVGSSSAQGKEEASSPNAKLNIGAGIGFNSYMGDLVQEEEIGVLTNLRPGYSLFLEKRFGSFLGIGVSGMYGHLSGSRRTKEVDQNMNFETRMIQMGLDVTLHLDNGVIFPRDVPFSPFLASGFDYLMFTPYGDLKDGNGDLYHYWDDGSIRAEPQSQDQDSARILIRDHEYETELDDSLTGGGTGAFSIPLTFGLKYKLAPPLEGRVSATYNLAFTDHLDAWEANGDNDAYLRTKLSLVYKFGLGADKDQERYKDVDFTALAKEDEDDDGVSDLKDDCSKTPEGVEVDKVGCPIDTDGDGIADHLDKEPDTKEGAKVDQQGRTLTDDRIAEMMKEESDSANVVRSKAFSDDPEMKELVKIKTNDASNPDKLQQSSGAGQEGIPDKFKPADLNKDGFISADEITQTIDAFFEGEVELSPQGIRDLIDFFFEQ